MQLIRYSLLGLCANVCLSLDSIFVLSITVIELKLYIWETLKHHNPHRFRKNGREVESFDNTICQFLAEGELLDWFKVDTILWVGDWKLSELISCKDL